VRRGDPGPKAGLCEYHGRTRPASDLPSPAADVIFIALRLNRANFDIPFNDPDGQALFDDAGARLPTAGRIFETSTDAREVQIAVRFLF